MSKAIKLAFSLILLVGMLAFTTASVSAATTPATPSITLTVLQDDNKTPFETTATRFISSACITLINSAGETLDYACDYSCTINENVVTVSNFAYADTYQLRITANGCTTQYATAIVPVKTATTTVNAKLAWSSKSYYSEKKSGVIAGNVVDESGNPLAGVTVKAYNKNTIYETTSAATTGAYKLYVPAGTYTLVIVGKEANSNSDTYVNISQTVKVTAGQATGPMNDTNAKTTWASLGYPSNLGLSGLTISGSSKTVTGTAYKGTTVSVFTYYDLYNGSNSLYPVQYKYLGSQKVKASGTATTGTFSIKLSEYPAGKNFTVKVIDSALNEYLEKTYETSDVPKMTATLTGDSAATIATPTTITITEPTGVTSGNFNSNITTVKATYATTTLTLTPSQYSKATKGKLIINSGVLSAKTYTITISATGYNDASVTQTVGPSTTTPPTNLTGTFTIKAGGGSTSGSAQFSAIGTPGTGNSLAYVVSSQSTIQFKLGDTLTGHTALAAATDITGVSATSTKYIHVYEISATGAVVKAKVFTLTAAQIKQ